MAVDRSGVQLDPTVRAQRTPPKAAAINWPMPVDRRLEQLVELANENGANTRRNELCAALVAAAPVDADELLEMILTLRRASVRDVVLDVRAEADVVHLPKHGPGRRKTSKEA